MIINQFRQHQQIIFTTVFIIFNDIPSYLTIKTMVGSSIIRIVKIMNFNQDLFMQ